MSKSTLIPAERIERRILLLRGQKVLLDFQLAELYEVETKALNQAVKRNIERFPEDFMFQLSEEEMLDAALTSGIIVPWPVRLFSCGAASDSSPRREPWVGSIRDQAPAGATDSFAPAGAWPSRCNRTHGSRRGLLSFAPLALGGGRSQSRVLAFTEQGVASLSGLLRSRRVAKITVSVLQIFARLTERERIEADNQASLFEIQAWLKRDRFTALPPAATRLPTPVIHFGRNPGCQSRFAPRKSKFS